MNPPTVFEALRSRTPNGRRARRQYHPQHEVLEQRQMLSDARAKVVLPFVAAARSARSGAVTAPSAEAFAVGGISGQSVSADFTLTSRRANYRNEVGLFLVDDASGRIGRFHPGDRGYARAALGRRVVLFRPGQDAGSKASVELPGGGYFGTYLIANGTAERWLAGKTGTGHAYFSFRKANADRYPHVRTTAPGTLGFEDLWRGGDRDHDDAVVRVKLTPMGVDPGTQNKPTLTLEQPTPGLLTNRDVTVVGQALDPVTGLARVELSLDRGASRAVAFDAQGRFQAKLGLPLDGSADGLHSVTAWATNTKNFTSPHAASTFVLDTRPPLVTLSGPAAGLLVNRNVTVTGRATDGLSGVGSLEARTDSGPFRAVSFDGAGNFQLPTSLPLDHTADGSHTVTFRATDRAGNVSDAVTYVFTLDTTPPPVTLTLDPASDTAPAGDDTTTLGLVDLVGTTEPGLTVTLASTGATVTSDGLGHFRFSNVALTAAANPFEATAVDAAGNIGRGGRTVYRCGFPDDLAGWTVSEQGGGSPGEGTVAVRENRAVLTEGTSFEVTLSRTFTVPENPTTIAFAYADLNFDKSSSGLIRDAFEAALLGDNGLPVVPTFTSGRDAFFNVTEGVSTATGSGVTVAGQVVTVDISRAVPGTTATLVFRLVNNDADTTTSVAIVCASVPAAVASTLPATGSATGFGTLDTRSWVSAPLASLATARIEPTTSPADPTTGAVTATTSVPAGPPAQSAAGDSLLDAAGSVVFTTSEDFLQGTMFNTDAVTVQDEVQLVPSGEAQTYPFIWVSNSAESTVSRLDTRTGREVGRYRTGGTGNDPSRIAVTGRGDAWVANRGGAGTVIKVLLDRFVDRNGNGVVDTCQDLNGDGRITDAEVLPWDANGDGQPDDERIALVLDVGYGPRGLAVDANDDVWVADNNGGRFYIFDGETGALESTVRTGYGSYGAIIDGRGQLWSVPAAGSTVLVHVDTTTRRFVELVTVASAYGVTVDRDGVVWTSGYLSSTVSRYDPVSRELNVYPTEDQYNAGIAVDRQGNVWFGTSNSNRIWKLSFEADRKTLSSRQAIVVGSAPKSASIDADGYLWTVCLGSDAAYKIDTTTNAVVAGWPVPTGRGPYNYSDMTGAVRLTVTGRSGSWTEVIDGEGEGLPWVRVEVDTEAPSNTTTALRIRASDSRTQLASAAWVDVPAGSPFPTIRGRFLEVQAALTSSDPASEPVLREVRVQSIPRPTVQVSSPPAGAKIDADQRVVLTGQVDVGRSILPEGTRARNAVVLVTVNGEPVDVLDPSGRFFARVAVRPGQNAYTVEATDVYGLKATTTHTLEGIQRNPGEVDFSLLSDITASFAAEYARTSFHRDEATLYADVAVRNIGRYPTSAPLYVGVDHLSDPAVLPVGAAGYTPQGLPYYDVSGLVPDGRLLAGQSTGNLAFAFWNPEGVRFTYDLVFFGLLDSAPVFTSVPVVETATGRAYAYDADAADPDGDAVAFALAEAPAGMTIEVASGRITWAPSDADLGTHEVVVRSDDGRGGWSEQRFTVNVTTPPPNRPPVITSLPEFKGYVGRPYVYDVEATDPDGDGLTYAILTPTVVDVPIANAGFESPALGDGGMAIWNIDGWDATDHGHVGVWNPSATILNAGRVAEGENMLYCDGGTVFQSLQATLSPSTSYELRVAVGRRFDVPFPVSSIELWAGGEKLAAAEGVQPRQGLFQDVVVSFTTGVSHPKLGQPLEIRLTSTGLGGVFDDVRLTARDDLPKPPGGMTIDPVSGRIAWTPAETQTGVWDVAVLVTDGRGGSATQGYQICVTPDPENHRPVIVSQPVTLTSSPAGRKSRIVVANDEWVLSDVGFSRAADTVRFAQKLANFYTEGRAGSFLAYSNNHGLAGSSLANTMRDAGHTWTVSTSVPFTLETLSQYDAVFLCGYPADNDVLVDYVRSGGGVYVAGGSGSTGAFGPDAVKEATAWNSFLSAFGLSFKTTYTGSLSTFSGSHEIFDGVSWLYHSVGQGVVDLDSQDQSGRLVVQQGGEGWYAVYDAPADAAPTGYEYGVEAIDPDTDVLSFDLVSAPDGMVIDQDSGRITWDLSAYTSPVSTFDQSDEGWTFNGGTLTYLQSGGNPDGFLHLKDVLNSNMTLGVPDRFTGNLSRFLGGTLAFDAIEIENPREPASGFGTVTIVGNTKSASRDLAPNALGREWETFSALLSADAWGVSEEEWAEILSDVKEIQVNVESGLRVGVETVGFDNFRMVMPDTFRVPVTVRVTDGRGGSDVQSFTVDVTPTPAPPIDPPATSDALRFTNAPTTTAPAGLLWRFDAAAVGPDPASIAFDLPNAPAGMTVHPTLGVLVWTPTADQVGTHQVVLRVQDGRGGVALLSFEMVVRAPNAAPVVTSTPPGPATAGLPYVYDLRAQDAEGEPLSFALGDGAPDGLRIDGQTGRLEWTPATDQVGTHAVRVLVRDAAGNETAQAFDLEVRDTTTNRPPALVVQARGRAWYGNPYAALATATDPDGDPVTFRLESAPDGMTIDDRTGVISWSPAAGQGGTHTVAVDASDGRPGGETTATFTVEVVTQDADAAPRVVAVPRLTALVGRPYASRVEASDPDGDPVTWSLVSAPRGLSIDPATGELRWTPSLDQLGANTVVVRAQDTLFQAGTLSFQIVVTCVNRSPELSSKPPTEAWVAEPYLYAVRAADPEEDPLRFTLLAAPPGMAIDAATGVVRWTPTADQGGKRFTVAVQVDDGQGNLATQSFAVDVASTPRNRPPVITSRPRAQSAAGSTYTYAVTATDPEGTAVRYELGTHPDGMGIDEGTGVVSWTPGDAAIGSHIVTVRALDAGGGVAQQSFLLEVKPELPPVIATTAGTEWVTAGNTYRLDVQASDPNGDPVTFRVAEGPAAMAVDAFGRLRWLTTPADVGSHPVKVVVTDAAGSSSGLVFNLEVRPDTEAPTVSVTATPSPAAVGQTVTFRVVAGDNVRVESLRLLVDGQPLVLNADGTATRVMDRAGNFTVTAAAFDPSSLKGEGSTTLRVGDPSNPDAPVPGTPGLPPHPGYTDPTDTNRPVVAITSPTFDTRVTTATPVIGTVDDPENNLWFWRVFYAGVDAVDLGNLSVSDPDWVKIGEGTTEVSNGQLAVFDPTLLARGPYAIALAAYDVNGRGYVTVVTVGVEGNLVLGNFRLEFTDLQIPLAGIPITVTRVYDTLQAGREGDFGYGWTLGVQDAHVLETVPAGSAYVPNKTRVFLTAPDGRRIGFTYTPKLTGSWFGTIAEPRFTADPGVTETLEVLDKQVGTGGILGGLSGPYNPDVFVLTTKDGTRYTYDQARGLQTIQDRNGNLVTFTASGIEHSSGASIRFERDNHGRIVSLTGPGGAVLTYSYDARGDLVRYVDAVGAATTFKYRDNPTHYLESVTDSLGRVTRAEFDADGRLTGTSNPEGVRLRQGYDLDAHTGTFTDADGHVTTVTYDDRGNVVRAVDPRGATISTVYNDRDLPIRITDPGGATSTLEYDSRGNVTAVTDPLGNVTKYTYNVFNSLATVTDALGRTSTGSYDAAGHLVTFVNAAGVATHMGYDAQGRQTSYTNPGGFVTLYEYDSPDLSLPTRVVFPDGAVRRMTYNALGEVTSRIDENGATTTFSYNAGGSLTAVTDGEGFTTRLTYAGNRVATVTDPLGLVTRYEYDGAGRMTAEVGPDGIAHRYEYDRNNRLVRETKPSGVTYTYTYDASGNRTSESFNPTRTYEYDLRGNVIRSVDGVGNETRFEYDARNRIVRQTDALGGVQQFVYDAVGNLVTYTDANGHSVQFTYDRMNNTSSQADDAGRRFVWTYDEFGNTRTLSDANGHRTEFVHDKKRTKLFEYGNAVAYGYQFPFRSVINPLGEETRYNYDPVGNLVSVSDAEGRSVHYEYDGRNLVTAVVDALGGRTTYAYDGAGRLSSETDALGRVTSYTYDARGNLETVTDPGGATWTFASDGGGNVVRATDPAGATTTYQYNAHGLPTAVTDALGNVTRYRYDAEGNLLGTTDALGFQETYERDALGRLARYTDQAGKVWTYSYDAVGNRTSYTDPLGRSVAYAYDPANRLVTSTNELGQTLGFAYDGADNLLSLTDTAGHTTRYAYDAADQMVRETDPVGLSRLYAYDHSGNLTSVTDRNGRTRAFTYDALSRMTREEWLGGASPGETVTYAYDAVGNLVAAGDADSSYAMTYDALDRLATVDNQGTRGLPRVLMSYGYDAAGNRISARDNLGAAVTSSFDKAGQLTSRTWSGAAVDPVRVDFGYDARGELTSLTRLAGATGATRTVGKSTYTYGATGLTTGITHLDALDRVLADYDYQYDDLGQLVRESSHGSTTNYAYDRLGQLVRVTTAGRPESTYDYDASGNRLEGSTRVDGANRLLEDDGFLYTYDGEGNLVTKTDKSSGNVTSFTYDHRNRLTGAEERTSGGTLLHHVAYSYDVFDRRTTQDVDGTFTAFAYDGARAWADFDAGGTVTARYLYGDASADGLLARWRPGEGTSWYLADRLDSVRDVADASGRVVDTIDYDAFGNIVSETAPARGDRFKFNGRPYEPATGLYDYRARNYDPGTGRFLTEDTWAFAAGDTNFYRYALNAPTNFQDPTGHSTLAEEALLSMAIVGAMILTPVSCVTSFGFNMSMGDSEGYAKYSTAHPDQIHLGERIPAPNSDLIKTQVMSCALLPISAIANGVFATIGTTFLLVGSHDAYGQPYDCVDFEAYKADFEISDYFVKVRMSRGGTCQNRLNVTIGEFNPWGPLLILGFPWLKAGVKGLWRWLRPVEEVAEEVLPMVRQPTQQVKPAIPRVIEEKALPCRINKSAFPDDPHLLTERLGVPPSRVTTTPDGTPRIVWQPNENTRIRFESHPEGLSPGDPGFNPRHHGPHYHVETRPPGAGWRQSTKALPPGYTPGSGTGFLPGEPFPGL